MTPIEHTPPVPDDDEIREADAAAEFGAMLEAFERSQPSRPAPTAAKGGDRGARRSTNDELRLEIGRAHV